MALTIALAGCSTLPTQGPNPIDVLSTKAPNPDKVQYVVADLTPAVVARLRESPLQVEGGSISDSRPAPALRLGIGDLVSVTIFEAAAGGLFIPTDAGSRPGNYVSLPAQEVDRAGNITVPYAGQVPASGHTLPEVQATIESRLRNRAIEPQALVTLQESRSGLVSVTGEVNQSVRYALTKSGDRILDAIARAGGIKDQAYETYVTLQRGKQQRAKIYFNRLVQEPANNVYVYPGDTIVVSREVRSFMALGASGQNGQISFDAESLTLAQAVGKSGGILDARGDPAQVFLYRLEPKRVVADMGFDVTPFITPTVPVVYRVNMREPDGFFMSSKFPMHDQDILFVSNAPTVEISKFLSLLQLGGNTVVDSTAARVSLR